MRSKPVDIGNTVRRGIIHYRTTGDPYVPENEYDAGNGACMRCLPIALTHWNATTARLKMASRIQAHVTHNSRISDAGTETVLQMLVSAFKGEGKESLQSLAQELAERHSLFRYDGKPRVNPSGWIVETLQAVFQAFFAHDSFEDILIDLVNRGGDADTTGAIGGMLAGACYGLPAVPEEWLKSLKPEVRRSCEGQSTQLLAMAAQRF